MWVRSLATLARTNKKQYFDYSSSEQGSARGQRSQPVSEIERIANKNNTKKKMTSA
jgi:hypothetical protein